MFTRLLPSSENLFTVEFSDCAEKHFLKGFRKKYKGIIWKITEDSIVQNMKRIGHASNDLQKTQQVDELWHAGDIWVFKYDFRVAQTRVSTKAAGNRVVAVLNNSSKKIKIVLIYNKTDLPKNIGETQYIKQVIKEECPEVGWR